MQNEFITSPTNHDFLKQLDKINDQIDSITPTSAKWRSKTTPGTRSSSMSLSKVGPRIDVSWKESTLKESPSRSKSGSTAWSSKASTGKNLSRDIATPKDSKSSSEAGTSKRSCSKPLSNVKSRIDLSWKESPSSAPAPKRSAQLCYGFFKRPANDNSSPNKPKEEKSPSQPPADKLSSVEESNNVDANEGHESSKKQIDTKQAASDGSGVVEKPANGQTKTWTKPKLKKSVAASASTKTLAVLSGNSFKTPHSKRSEEIAAIRDKMRVLVENTAGDINVTGSEDSKSQAKRSDPPAARTMKKELSVRVCIRLLVHLCHAIPFSKPTTPFVFSISHCTTD